MNGSVEEGAAQEDVNRATVYRWMEKPGCPFVIKKGRRGPGNAAVLDLEKLKAWRTTAHGPVGLTAEEAVRKIAEALRESLNADHADIRADIAKEQAAAVLLVAWERSCKSFGVSFRFTPLPDSIFALMRML